MQTNPDEDVLAYTQRQATRIARADDPWTELMSAAFEAVRGGMDGDAAVESDPAAERSIPLPKRLGALALLAFGNAAKGWAESRLQKQRSGDETAAEDYEVAPATEETQAGDGADEESGSIVGKLFRVVVVAALVGGAAYVLKQKRGSGTAAEEFDEDYGEAVQVDGNDEETGIGGASEGVGTEDIDEGIGTEGASEGVGTEDIDEGIGTEGASEGVGMEGTDAGIGTEGTSEGVGMEGASEGIGTEDTDEGVGTGDDEEGGIEGNDE